MNTEIGSAAANVGFIVRYFWERCVLQKWQSNSVSYVCFIQELFAMNIPQCATKVILQINKFAYNPVRPWTILVTTNDNKFSIRFFFWLPSGYNSFNATRLDILYISQKYCAGHIRTQSAFCISHTLELSPKISSPPPSFGGRLPAHKLFKFTTRMSGKSGSSTTTDIMQHVDMGCVYHLCGIRTLSTNVISVLA